MKVFNFRVRQLLAVMAAATCAACAGTPAGTPLQSNASAAAPVVAVGDSWAYRVRDGFTGLDRGSQNYRVTAAGDRISVAVTREGAGGDEVQIFDSAWNWLKHPATHLQSFEYSPAYPAFAFPLAPGKTWRARLTATDPADGRRFPLTVDGTVLGWERIRVPAGEFDALKIKRVVYLEYRDLIRGRSEILEYEWYVPAVKQSVRREASALYLSFIYGGGDSHGFLRVQRPDGRSHGYVKDDWLISELMTYSVR